MKTLLVVLLQFRQESVAVMGDIEGIFHQVKIPEEDVDFLRLYGDMSKLLRDYRMIVHLFGAVSSLSANLITNEIKVENSVLNMIPHDFYVEDCLKLVANEEPSLWSRA